MQETPGGFESFCLGHAGGFAPATAMSPIYLGQSDWMQMSAENSQIEVRHVQIL